MKRLAPLVAAWCSSSLACATPVQGNPPGLDQIVGLEQVQSPLLDRTIAYEQLGFVAGRGSVPFIASVHFLSGSDPDSTLAVLALSMANSALSFRRFEGVFEADYVVNVSFVRDERSLGQIATREVVRVGSFEETQRQDESVVLQQFTQLPPGPVTARVVVRDRHGSRFSRAELVMHVPWFGEGPVVSLIPVFGGTPRESRKEGPTVLINPRATVLYGTDTLSLYLEAHRVPSGGMITIRGVDGGDEIWRTSTPWEPSGGFAASLLRVGPEALPPGGIWMEAAIAGSADTARTPVIVTFPGLPAVVDFEEALSLLRYFGASDYLADLRTARGRRRAAIFRDFWLSSDPDTGTAENEAIREYFGQVVVADTRFPEADLPGWLTDRGMVFITLGQPDRVEERSTFGSSRRVIRWTYVVESEGKHGTLDFVSEGERALFELAPGSRLEYDRLLDQKRRGGLGGPQGFLDGR
jgi:GWxTD domain-containing protein